MSSQDNKSSLTSQVMGTVIGPVASSLLTGSGTTPAPNPLLAFANQPKKTVSYIPAAISTSLDSLHVTEITIAAHPPDAGSSVAGKDGKTNHWVLYLATSSASSIRLDINPTGDAKGTALLIISKLPYKVSNNVVKTMDLSPKEPLSVKDIVDTILSAHYDKYRFTSGGQGCRFWVTKVLALLKEHNFITVETQFVEAQALLRKVWISGGAEAPANQQTGIAEGSFYQ